MAKCLHDCPQIELHALLVFALRSFENSGFFHKECSLAGIRGGRGKGVSSQQRPVSARLHRHDDGMPEQPTKADLEKLTQRAWLTNPTSAGRPRSFSWQQSFDFGMSDVLLHLYEA